jgi:hypothetical protein
LVPGAPRHGGINGKQRGDSGQRPVSQEGTALHAAHLRTLEALFRHPTAHNLEWMDVVALIEKIGAVQQKAKDKFTFDVCREPTPRS